MSGSNDAEGPMETLEDFRARARAWLAGRDYVLPDDVHGIAHEVLRHRVLLSYEAEAEGIRPDQVIARLLDLVPLP